VSAPRRHQMRRTKGWRKPEGAIYVGRPSPYGNPFPVDGDWIACAAIAAGFRADKAGRRAAAVAFHRAWLTGRAPAGPQLDDIGAIEFSDGTLVTMGEHSRLPSIAMLGARPVRGADVAGRAAGPHAAARSRPRLLVRTRRAVPRGRASGARQPVAAKES
jgi:hypothetical protein